MSISLDTVADWLALGALVLPLAALAWSGWEYIRIQKAAARQREFENFFQTLERIQNKQGSALMQQAAIFELRNYPHYKDLILRVCENAERNFSGQADEKYAIAQSLAEFGLTAQHFERTTRG